MKTSLRFFALLLSTFILHPSAFPQGNLTPPGPPTPTMKTLDQVEARTIVNAANTPGDASNLFIITAPGSYYLTGNITGVSGKNAISINADNVTLDLNGFALIGVGGFSLNGINVSGVHSNLRIRNGSAKGWGGHGIDCSNATNSQFDHLRVSQNVFHGLICGDGNVLNEISAQANAATGGPGTGIFTGNRCTLAACYAANQTTGDGIRTGDSCTITASTAVGNGIGFDIQNHCTMIGCTAVSNSNTGINPANNCTIKNCTAALNGFGIVATSRSVIVNCNLSQNTYGGILFNNDNLITGNNASKNGGDGFHTDGTLNRIDGNTANDNVKDGFLVSDASEIIGCTANSNAIGIHATGNKNRIEGNATMNNTTGFKVEVSGNLIIKNSNTGGITAFNLAAGNSVGEQINVFNGGAGATITSTNSWANFLY